MEGVALRGKNFISDKLGVRSEFRNRDLIKPVLTIGVCVRNCESTIDETIESIIKQDLKHELMELIFVEDGSQDNTLSVIQEYVSKIDIPARVFHISWQGLGYARQMVVDNARGEYIVWVDGDMLICRDFVEKQVKFMKQHPTVGIAKAKYIVGNTDGNKNMVSILENVEFLLNTISEGETSLKSLGASGCIYRVEAIRQVGGFDSSIDGAGEDTDAENRIREAGWLLQITSASFYEIRRQNWKSLWEEYFWHGKGGYQVFRKNWRTIELCKMMPPVALAAEFLRIPKAYRIIRRKAVLLLPFHYMFKRVAWFLGFIQKGLEKER